MGTWTVRADEDPASAPLVTIRSYRNDRTVSLHMPSPDPVLVTTAKVEELRLKLAAAIADSQAAL